MADNLQYEDYPQAGITLLGMLPGVGDVASGVSKVGKFLLKNADSVGGFAEVLRFVRTSTTGSCRGRAEDIKKVWDRSNSRC